MSTTFIGTLFDGETLATRALVLEAGHGQLRSQTDGVALDVAIANVRTSDRLASLPRFLYLPDGRTIETPDNEAIDALLARQQRGHGIATVHWLETRARVAAAATFVLIATVAATIWWGLPILAQRTAMAVPLSIEKQAGQAALGTINRLLAPTQLKRADQARVNAQLDRLLKARPLPGRPEVVFRSMGGKFPNAFALPGGLIVVSDELVALANDEELAAVLAHEIGHWQLRHGLQGVLRSSAALLVVSTVTGDLSTLTTFAGTIPFALLQRGYSREFEEAADAYAVDLLRQAHINVAHFATILKKLDDSRPKQGQDLTYLSTHPATSARIRRINPDGHLPPPVVVKSGAPSKLIQSPLSTPLPFNEIKNNVGIVDFSKGGTPPRCMHQIAPEYPFEMAANKIEGHVVVEFVIDQNGDVQEPRIVRSTYKEFEAPAVAAILLWKFVPGQLRGRKVATRVSQVIEFNLEDPPGDSSAATAETNPSFRLPEPSHAVPSKPKFR